MRLHHPIPEVNTRPRSASRENVFEFISSKYQQKSDFFLSSTLKKHKHWPCFYEIFVNQSSQCRNTSTSTHSVWKFRRIYSLQNRLTHWVSRRARLVLRQTYHNTCEIPRCYFRLSEQLYATYPCFSRLHGWRCSCIFFIIIKIRMRQELCAS